MERTPPGASRLYPSQGTPCETSAQLQSLQRGGPPSRWISPARPVSDSSTLPDMFAGASTWLEDPLKVLRQRKLLGSLSSAILGPQQSHRGDSREGTGWAPAVRGLGAPNLTPEGGLGLRWLVSGWRRGSVPNNKFDLRPFAVAQHMGQIDPASCPFCAVGTTPAAVAATAIAVAAASAFPRLLPVAFCCCYVCWRCQCCFRCFFSFCLFIIARYFFWRGVRFSASAFLCLYLFAFH